MDTAINTVYFLVICSLSVCMAELLLFILLLRNMKHVHYNSDVMCLASFKFVFIHW